MFTPIVIAEHDDISVHGSPAQAAEYINPVDVTCGDCTAYDAEGNLLDVLVAPVEEHHHFLMFRWERKYERVRLDYHQPIENRREEMRGRLAEFMARVAGDEPYERMDVPELIERASRRMPWMV